MSRRRRRRAKARVQNPIDAHPDDAELPTQEECDQFNRALFGERFDQLRTRATTKAPPGLGIGAEYFDKVNILTEKPVDSPENPAVPSIMQPLMTVDTWRSEHEQGWVRVESVVDSGASAPVAPLTMAPGVPTRDSPGSLAKRSFFDASGGELKNLGEQELNVVTDGGIQTSILFQLAEKVTRPLMSVSTICDRGNRVIFGRGGGVIQNIQTGQEIPFERRGGIYSIGFWIQGSQTPGAPAAAASAAPGASGASAKSPVFSRR